MSNYIDGRTLKEHHCIECAKEINFQSALYGSGRCQSCAQKLKMKKFNYEGKNNPNFANFWLEEQIKRQSKKMKLYYKNHPERINTKKANEKVRKLMKKNKFFNINHNKNNYYNGIYMRSNWEILFAQFLNLSNIKYLYESKAFDLGNTTYTPDFYLPEFDCYIEIKGFWRSYSLKKYKLFKKQYKSIKIEVFNKKKLDKLGIL